MSVLELEKSSTNHFIVYLLWEQAPNFLSLRDVCTSRERAEIGKQVVENEYTKVKRRLIFIEKCEIDHLHGSVEMFTLSQLENQKRRSENRYLSGQLMLLQQDYDKAVKRIKELEKVKEEAGTR